jgi:aspartyl-tRNA(Asn)/glutamyl-tRNA(Gln) amidotransferase subunit C
MKVDHDLLKHVAEVARLKLTEKEFGEFLPQFEEVLSAFSQLNELATDGIDPSFQPVRLRERLRDDSPEPSLAQEEALSNAEHKDGYIKGPKSV